MSRDYIIFATFIMISWGCTGSSGKGGGGSKSKDAAPEAVIADSVHVGDQGKGGSATTGDQTAGTSADGGTSGSGDEGEEEKPAVLDESAVVAALGFRNFDQINQTMAALTGVSSETEAVRTAFLELKAQLPTNNSVDEVTPAKISAITKLGAYYCDALVNDGDLREPVFGTFDFNQNPAQAFADVSSRSMAQTLISRFWGTDLANLPELSANIQTVVDLVDQIRQGLPDNADTTRNVAMGACAAVLASASTLIF